MTSSLGSDLSINNAVRLGSTDNKIDSQGAVKKALDSRKSENTQSSGVNSIFFSKVC